MRSEDAGNAASEVLVLPATRRDGEAIRAYLAQAGLACRICTGVPDLACRIDGEPGAVVLTDTSLADAAMPDVLAALKRQPAWSDLPIVLLGQITRNVAAGARNLAAMSNVTLLEKPTSVRTLLSAIQTSLRARQRQFQIRDAELALRTASRRKDEFLAMLAHELRNPLASIRSAGELLSRRHGEDAQTQSTAGILKRQVIHLTRLVDDLLDVSRITQDRIELQLETLDLASVIADALESVQPLIRDNEHRVILRRPDAPVLVRGDRARLVQCVANILINAAKYTDARGEIKVDLEATADEAVVVIADNGIGISSELLPAIFQLFVQSDRSLDRSQGGLGIGLSVVHRLITMHEGQVTAASAGLDRGSRFEIRLPLVRAPIAARAVPRVCGVKAKRILIVDDNVDAASSLAELLQLDGHEAEAVFSSEQALQRAAEFDADVVLLDIGLPDLDGYEVARRLRSRGLSARIVALTGYGRPSDIAQALSAGFDAHLLKPVDFAELERVLAS